MVVLPVATPVTIPETDPMVAIAVFALLQLPPVVASLSVIVRPTQAVDGPVMAAGSATTVAVTVV